MSDDSSLEERLYKILKKAPKCQLHLHLDGSLSFQFIKKSFNRMLANDHHRVRKVFPEGWEPSSYEELRRFLIDMKKGSIKTGMIMKPCANWEVFDFCNNFLQTKEDLSDATCDLVTRLYEDHSVNYIEVRFAPVLHMNCGLTMDEVVKSVVSGFKQAQALNSNILGGIILCALRSYPVEDARKLIPLIQLFPEVVGFDIAGDEKSYPLALFTDVIDECISKRIHVTVHAGEWPNTLENVKLAISHKVDRIGHAIAVKSASSDLFSEIRKNNISIEVNLTANCANPLKVPLSSYEDHPYSTMLKERIKIAGLNCDNLLLSGNEVLGAPNPTRECVKALLNCHVSIQDLYNSMLGGYDSAFSTSVEKAKGNFIHSWEETILPNLNDILCSH